MSTPGTSPIVAHYTTGLEAGRLDVGPGQLERARTEELLSRHLPPPPARVLDVGGGPGAYATWLARQGYDVTLIDLVPLHVEQATAAFAKLDGARARARQGDARALDVEPGAHDVVLLMGPLYHLQERADRVRALREAARVLRPGGLLAATTISRYASLLDGMARLLVRDPEFARLLETDLRSGRHDNATDLVDYFTTAFFHHPDEILDELTEAGFQRAARFAIEGPFWCLAGFDEVWGDARLRRLLLDSLRAIESEPTLIGASAHILAVASA